MKEINQEQLLKLSDAEKCEVLKAIILGKIKYIGDDNNNGNNTKVKKYKIKWIYKAIME